MAEQILVAVDGSDNSLEALKEAVKLAGYIKGKLIVVNVQPSLRTIHTKLFISDETIKEYQKEQFDEATKKAIDYLQTQEIEYEIKKLIGDPVQQICKLAEELDVKYITLGTRGMGLLRGTVLGSVSNGVLHETEIPTLIIPQKN